MQDLGLCVENDYFYVFFSVKETSPIEITTNKEEMCHDSTKKKADWKTISYAELPEWYDANPYLLNHHRPELNSTKLCLMSIFRIHTETANIWTHLLGKIKQLYMTKFEKQLI